MLNMEFIGIISLSAVKARHLLSRRESNTLRSSIAAIITAITAIVLISTVSNLSSRNSHPTTAMKNHKSANKTYAKRLEAIIHDLLTTGEANFDNLSKRLGVDKSTLRRDREDILAVKDVKAVWGGLKLGTPKSMEGRSYSRQQEYLHQPEKADIGAAFAELVNPEHSMSASAGSTVATALRAAARTKSFSIVTNSGTAGEALRDTGDSVSIFVTGGIYSAPQHAFLGDQAIESFRARRCFDGVVGVSGIVVSEGEGLFFVHNGAEQGVLRAQIGSIRNRLFVLADIHKFGRIDAWEIASIPARVPLSAQKTILITNEFHSWAADLSAEERPRIEQTYYELKSLTSEQFEFVEVPKTNNNKLSNENS